jgi:hypothetical protein
MLIIDRQWSQMCDFVTLRRHASRWINWLQSQRPLQSPLLSTFIPLEFGVSDSLALRSTSLAFLYFPLISGVRYAQVFARCKCKIKLVSQKLGDGGWGAGRGVRVGCLRVAIASEARRNVESNTTKQTLPPVAHCP